MSVKIAKRAKGKRKLSFISEKQTKSVPKVFQEHNLSTLLFANFAPPKSSKHDGSQQAKKWPYLGAILFTHYLYCKHCQRHNGPEGWVHITRSQYTVHRHIEQITISESRLSINFKISTKHRLNLKLRSWPNLASEYWPRFNFVTSTKHQQQNTDQTSASKSRRTSTSKSWPTLVLKV